MAINFIKNISFGILVALLCSTHSVMAQIGINTENIGSGILLHIDPKKNNATTETLSPEQISDDIVVDTNGNVGVGTVAPTAKLHIVTGGTAASPNPQVALDDGMQAINRVLTSNNDGTGRWRDYVPGAALGLFDTEGVDIVATETKYKNIKASLKLAQGEWLITYAIPVQCNNIDAPNGSRIWVNSTIGDQNTLDASQTYGTPSADILGSNINGDIVWADKNGILTSRYIINNTSNGVKEYFILAGMIDTQGSPSDIKMLHVGKNTGNCSFYAFRITEN